jgi:endoglucanase
VLPANERKKPIPSDKLLIDVGLPPQELSTIVQVGDLITMNRKLIELKGELVAGKAFDNRASVVAAVACLEELGRVQHHWDVYAVATVQEEMGYKGAITSTFGLQPDLGIAIDVTWATQPGVPEEYAFDLGKGPAIACGPNFHPKFQEAMVETAKALELSYHLEPTPRPGGTDAYAIQVSREGIPSALLSIPQRNMHTPVEQLSVRDIDRVGRWLAAFIGRLDEDFMSSLAWELGLEDEPQ